MMKMNLELRVRWALLVVFSAATVGCITPPVASPSESKSNKAVQREQAMPKSKIGKTPHATGLDPRARDIETSLGLQ